jgi:acetyltransferase-like isoleucine patch superfamily enzyme
MDYIDQAYLRAWFRYNQARRWWLERALRGRLVFGPNCHVWASMIKFSGEGRVEFGAGCGIERMPFPFILDAAPGANIRFGDNIWVRGKYRPNIVTAFENAAIDVGRDTFLNGAVISAREKVTIGRRVLLGWNTYVMDSNLHALDNNSPIKTAPVTIGDHAWIATQAMVLAGGSVGAHSVIAAASIVTSPIPDHVLAAGAPAKVIRQLGDRDVAP